MFYCVIRIDLRNYSDKFLTEFLWKYVPKEQLITAEFSRLLWDPNRAPTADIDFGAYDPTKDTTDPQIDLFWKKHPENWKVVDFNNQYIWKELCELTVEEKLYLIKKYHEPYHNKIEERTKKMTDMYGLAESYIIDVHDTDRLKHNVWRWNTVLRDWWFENIILSDRNHRSSRKEKTEEFAHELEKAFKSKVILNDKYVWWYVTRLHGEMYNKDKPEELWRNFMQIEFPRQRYVNGDLGKYDERVWDEMWENLTKALLWLAA